VSGRRQARDAAWSCGNQPAYHSMINRRSVPALHRACLHQRNRPVRKEPGGIWRPCPLKTEMTAFLLGGAAYQRWQGRKAVGAAPVSKNHLGLSRGPSASMGIVAARLFDVASLPAVANSTGRVPPIGVRAVGKWPVAATAQSHRRRQATYPQRWPWRIFGKVWL